MSSETLGNDIKGIIVQSAEEIKLNLVAVGDINADMRQHFYKNRDTMSPDQKRRVGTYLKGGMDLQIKGLIELLVGHLKTIREIPASNQEDVPLTEIDKAIEELGPYARTKLMAEVEKNLGVVNVGK